MADSIINRAGTKGAFEELLEAIRTLKNLEQTGREAGPADKALLAKFSGFGAVATKAFPDPITRKYAAGWEDLGRSLRDLLTDEEYRSAKATTYSAFYTSPVVMSEMHRALEKMGITMGSRGLEPGCGVGGFIGSAPIGLEFIGVEQDSLSGRMARLIHSDHDIRIEGFQDSDLPDGSVDFAIGNVPFAEIKIRHQSGRHSLHDFFFLKSLEAVRPGGVIALITSRYTMDKASPAVRELLAKQADFAGAIRLPMEAFTDQGTTVVTDIIFLRKKPRELDVDTPAWAEDHTWLTSSKAQLDGGEVVFNDYFQKHPEMVLGQMSVGAGMYNRQDLRVRSDGELGAALHAAVDGLPSNIVTARAQPLARAATINPDLPANLKEGSFFVASDKTVMQVVGGKIEPVMQRDKPLKADGTPGGKRLAGLITLKERARGVLRSQQDGLGEREREAARAQLRMAYQTFVAQFGPINKTTISTRRDGAVVRRMPNILRFRSDPDVYLVMALENYDERSGKGSPATIMQKDVVVPAVAVSSVETAKDGLLASLNHLGCVDIPYIAELYGHSDLKVVQELGNLIFFDPILDSYVPANEYLSGNVRQKLRVAEISKDPRAEGNAEELRAVQPEDLVAEEIDVTLGTPWIPARDVQQFLVETMGIAPSSVSVEYVQKEALWKVRVGPSLRKSAVASSEFGTEDIDAYTLVEKALNMRSPTVRRATPGEPGERDTNVVDQEATVAAREKQAGLKQSFSGWAFEDAARSERLVRFYNNNFNNIRLREFNGEHLTFDRMNAAITLRPHQKAAVWRNMSAGNTLLAHVVGAGKTFEMIAAGMEMKRTGLAKKPLYVVPNHMLEQFSREHLILYPDANLLVATKADLRKDRRQLLKSRMATGDWDGIVMTHSSFEKIAMSPDFQARFLSQQVDEYEELLTQVEDRSLQGNVTKKIEKLKAARAEKVREMADGSNKDGGLYFDELGIDQVFVDEAHMFKNLDTPTKMDRVAGIQTGGSKRAFDLLMKARFLQSRTPGRGLTFATGTPVSNSLGEMYTMMRYLMPEALADRGIEHFDAWAANFGEVINSLEISPDGKSLRVNTRFAKFKNIPELLALFRMSADVQTGAMLQLPVPELKGGKAEIVAAPMSERATHYQDALVKRYEKVRSGGVDPSMDNALKIITDGRKLALDPRLVDPMAVDDPDSKINQVVDRVYAVWERSKENRSTQMIFGDLGVKPNEWGFCVYDDIMDKLERRGVPRDEIANIGDANTDAKKEALFSTVRSGQVRVLLGSTSKMGTGTNVQDRLVALHHVDPPWRPADIEQREGRILRQGNRNKELGIPVEIYRYVTEGSFDAFMWQTLETKAKFISQAMSGDAGCRRADDIGGAELSYAEVKAIASGNPAMLVLAEMEMDLRQLTLLRSAHGRDQAKISSQVKLLPDSIAHHELTIAKLEEDIERRQETKGDKFVMMVGSRPITREKGEKKTARIRAQDALALAIGTAYVEERRPLPWDRKLGELGGLDIVLKAEVDSLTKGGRFSVTLEGADSYLVADKISPTHCPPLIHDLEQKLRSLDGNLSHHRAVALKMSTDLERYRERADTRFPSEGTYQELVPLKSRLQALLSQLAQPKQEVEEEERISLSEYLETLEADEANVEPAELSTEEEIHQIIDRYRTLQAQVKEAPSIVEPTEPEVVAKDLGQANDVAISKDPAEKPIRLLHEVLAEVSDPTLGDDDRVVANAIVEAEEASVQEIVTTATVETALKTTPAEPEAPQLLDQGDDKRSPSGPQGSDQAGDQGDNAIAIVAQEDEDGISWFSLAVKERREDSWHIQSLYPENADRENYAWEPRRKGYGWQDDAWVRGSLANADEIPDLEQYLSREERERLIPEQRAVLGHDVIVDDLEGSEISGDATPAEATPAEPAQVETQPRRNGRNGQMTPSPTSREQIGLFDALEPTPKPSTSVTQPISGRPVQGSLFDLFAAEKPPEKPDVQESIVARSFRAAALEVRSTNGPLAEEPQATSDRGGAQAARRLSAVKEDEDWTTESDELYRLEMKARGQLSKDDPLHVDLRTSEHDAEIEQWEQSLSPAEESDLQDLLENGASAPTERAVLGKFTAMVGNKPKLADIIHEAIEHYEPYGSMVQRIERESGSHRPTGDRGTRSLYNATLARRSGWEEHAP